MATRYRILLLGCCLALVATGCSSPTEVEERSEVAVLLDEGHAAVVSVPATATAGVAFTVTIQTLAGGCSRKGSTKMTSGAGRVLLEPFDIFWNPVGIQNCPDRLALYQHSAEVEFSEKGVAQVEVRGVDGVTGSVEILTFDVLVN